MSTLNQTRTRTSTWVLRLPCDCEATGADRVVGSEPEVQGIVGAEELLGVVLAAVLPDHISRGAVPVVDLQEVEVAVGAVFQVEEGEGDSQNLGKREQSEKTSDDIIISLDSALHLLNTFAHLVGLDADHPGTADQVVILIMTWSVRITEGACRAGQVTSTL